MLRSLGGGGRGESTVFPSNSASENGISRYGSAGSMGYHYDFSTGTYKDNATGDEVNPNVAINYTINEAAKRGKAERVHSIDIYIGQKSYNSVVGAWQVDEKGSVPYYYSLEIEDGSAKSGGGSVDFGNYKISSNELKGFLNKFAEQTGYNITVVGGDRTPARNVAVGGANGSRHIVGDAADIVVRGISNKNVAIQAYTTELFNTIIYYPSYNTPGALPPHVHVDWNPKHRNLLLIYKILDGSNKYVPWNP